MSEIFVAAEICFDRNLFWPVFFSTEKCFFSVHIAAKGVRGVESPTQSFRLRGRAIINGAIFLETPLRPSTYLGPQASADWLGDCTEHDLHYFERHKPRGEDERRIRTTAVAQTSAPNMISIILNLPPIAPQSLCGIVHIRRCH